MGSDYNTRNSGGGKWKQIFDSLNPVGGIVQPATFVELRFCEFAPESRAFFGVKNCENGSVRFEVIWVYFINALINLITLYIM